MSLTNTNKKPCVYKIKDVKMGGTCDECGRYCKTPIRIGFINDADHTEVVEGIYGSCCAKKYKVMDHCGACDGTNSDCLKEKS